MMLWNIASFCYGSDPRAPSSNLRNDAPHLCIEYGGKLLPSPAKGEGWGLRKDTCFSAGCRLRPSMGLTFEIRREESGEKTIIRPDGSSEI